MQILANIITIVKIFQYSWLFAPILIFLPIGAYKNGHQKAPNSLYTRVQVFLFPNYIYPVFLHKRPIHRWNPQAEH
jgi:hypothetical protein